MYLHRGHAHHSVCTLHEAFTEARKQTVGGLIVSTEQIDAIYRNTHLTICKPFLTPNRSLLNLNLDLSRISILLYSTDEPGLKRVGLSG